MKRALAPLTWWAIGIGYTLAVAVIVLPVAWLGSAAYVCAALFLVLATCIAARVHRVNRRFIASVSAIGGFFAASQIVDSLGDSDTITRVSNLLALGGSICIIIALVNMLSGRASANIRSVHRRRTDRRLGELVDQLGGAGRAGNQEPRRIAR